MKELELLKTKVEQLILQIDNLGQNGKTVKMQMQKIAYKNVLTLIEKIESGDIDNCE